MSNCGCSSSSSTTPATIDQLSVQPNLGRGGQGVATNADFTANSSVRQVQFYPPTTSPPAFLTLFLPVTPTRGMQITVVAAGIPVHVDGNGTNNVAGSAIVASNTTQTYTFTSNAFVVDPTLPGTWLPQA